MTRTHDTRIATFRQTTGTKQVICSVNVILHFHVTLICLVAYGVIQNLDIHLHKVIGRGELGRVGWKV